VTTPNAKKNEIDELRQVPRKGFFDDVRNAQSTRMNILDEEEFH
jgi:hypothetical protein